MILRNYKTDKNMYYTFFMKATDLFRHPVCVQLNRYLMRMRTSYGKRHKNQQSGISSTYLCMNKYTRPPG